MMLGSLGAKATAPVASVGAESVRGTHDVPASRLSQTPPLPTPISQWLTSDGSTAIEATRPEFTFVERASRRGAGPMLVHDCAALLCATTRQRMTERHPLKKNRCGF